MNIKKAAPFSVVGQLLSGRTRVSLSLKGQHDSPLYSLVPGETGHKTFLGRVNRRSISTNKGPVNNTFHCSEEI